MSILQEAMAAIPSLRTPRELDASDVALFCHADEIMVAVAFYKQKLRFLPPIYYLGEAPPKASVSGAHLHMAKDLSKAMPVHVFFLPNQAPLKTKFRLISNYLHEKDIEEYSIETWSISQFWGQNKKIYSEEDWSTIATIHDQLEDDASKYCFLAACKARQAGSPGCIPWARYAQYEHPLVKALPGDYVCEGGVDDGKSTQRLSELVGEYGQIQAFEPVRQSYAACLNFFSEYDNITLFNKGLWSSNCNVSFQITPGYSNAAHVVQDAASANAVCECVSIDNHFKNKKLDCIKLDIEGAEMAALQGAQQIIREQKPKLLLSIYHNQGLDLLSIPVYIASLGCSYKFYIGHHSRWFNETILYAV